MPLRLRWIRARARIADTNTVMRGGVINFSSFGPVSIGGGLWCESGVAAKDLHAIDQRERCAAGIGGVVRVRQGRRLPPCCGRMAAARHKLRPPVSNTQYVVKVGDFQWLRIPPGQTWPVDTLGGS